MSAIDSPERSALGGLVSAAEPARLAAALAAACVGGALAVGEPGPSSWRAWAAVALAALFLQAGGRLLVESADLRRAQTHPWQLARRGAVLSNAQAVGAAAACLALAALLGLLAMIERGWPLFWLGLVAILGVIAYAQGPALRDRALGAPLTFLLFGPLPVATAYLAVTGAWSPLAVRVSVPLGLLAAAAILAKEIRDAVDDGRAGATTLALFLRRPLADVLFIALAGGAYLWLVVLVAGGMLAPACLVPLLTLPAAVRLAANLRAAPDDSSAALAAIPDRAVRLYIRFAVLYAASVAISEIIWKRAV
jgi:1,4-dihydroxy-2-naphthoate octaprenyltransferase